MFFVLAHMHWVQHMKSLISEKNLINQGRRKLFLVGGGGAEIEVWRLESSAARRCETL